MQHSHRANLFHVSPAVAQHHFPAPGRAPLPRWVCHGLWLYFGASGRTGVKSRSCCAWHGCRGHRSPPVWPQVPPPPPRARPQGKARTRCTADPAQSTELSPVLPRETPPTSSPAKANIAEPVPLCGTPLNPMEAPLSGNTADRPSRPSCRGPHQPASHRLPSGDTDAPPIPIPIAIPSEPRRSHLPAPLAPLPPGTPRAHGKATSAVRAALSQDGGGASAEQGGRAAAAAILAEGTLRYLSEDGERRAPTIHGGVAAACSQC